MTGKQIAANLRGSKRKWAKGFLYAKGGYCVLGLKAFEHGVPVVALEAFQTDQGTAIDYDNMAPDITSLTSINDNSSTKRELIRTLEEDYATTRFPVEEFIRALKKWWKAEQKRIAREVKELSD